MSIFPNQAIFLCHLLFPILLASSKSSQCLGFVCNQPSFSIGPNSRQPSNSSTCTTLSARTRKFDYDLVIIGAGASGLFASGAASSVGRKTLLLDKADGYVGGDCSNAACVPSKAMHSIARMAVRSNDATGINGTSWLDLARKHSVDTVMAVREREDPSLMVERNPNLDLVFVKECHFVSPHTLEIVPRNVSNMPWRNDSESNGSDNEHNGSQCTTITVSSNKFLIATGASPIVPTHLETAARNTSVPLYTYRTVLQPNDTDTNSIWSVLQSSTATSSKPSHLVIAGGGPTACELGQSLARLGGSRLNVTIVAPAILPDYDVTLQRAAMQLLTKAGITLVLKSRVTNVYKGNDDSTRKYVEVDHGRVSLPIDALLLCLGRSPESSLSSLNLDAAGIEWHTQSGVKVKRASLQSISATNVYACGDCCNAVKERRAAHAAWTGFHAARNTILPLCLRVGSQAIHPTVPAVIYTDPELASVGLSYAECVGKYGKDGFQCMYVPEEGMDRADMDRIERPMIGFVELRATAVSGIVLGMTACGPAAAELANEVAVAISAKLTVRDLARSIHSYPSHGYLLHRIALAMATSNIWGLLSACGPVGKLLGGLGRKLLRASLFLSTNMPWRVQKARQLRDWEKEGSKNTILLGSQDGTVGHEDMEARRVRLVSYLEAYSDKSEILDSMDAKGTTEKFHPNDALYRDDSDGMTAWIKRKPE